MALGDITVTNIAKNGRCLLVLVGWVVFAAALGGCAASHPSLPSAAGVVPSTATPADYNYLLGPGDVVEIFVWRNPEVSTKGTIIRPDGKITMPLIEDMPAAGKTPTQLARDLEKALTAFIKDPMVTVVVGKFEGPFNEQIRVLGEATRPQALPYRQRMTVLDLMIAVGGLTEFADGNRASLVRMVNGEQRQFTVRLNDLIRDGDVTANVDMLPGDVLIIPQSWF